MERHYLLIVTFTDDVRNCRAPIQAINFCVHIDDFDEDARMFSVGTRQMYFLFSWDQGPTQVLNVSLKGALESPLVETAMLVEASQDALHFREVDKAVRSRIDSHWRAMGVGKMKRRQRTVIPR